MSSALDSGADKSKIGRSCAECRRSKLKCDRTFPCQSCIRRGCANICPDGTLAATKGNKVLIARAQQLAEEVASQTERIQQLEKALEEARRAHGDISRSPPSTSNQPTPFPDLDKIETLFDQDVIETSDAIGSLSIGVDGQAKYHGESASSEYFQQLLPEHSEKCTPDLHDLGLPWEIMDLCNAYPFGLRDTAYNKWQFASYIPPRARALRLADLYYENVAWMYDPIVRQDFMSSIMEPIYGTPGPPRVDHITPHRLSVFFVALASGAMYEDNTSAAMISEKYFALSRAVFSLDSITQEVSIAGVTAIFMAVRYSYQIDRSGGENRWLLLGLCTRLGQIIGLQRDSAGWNLNEEEIQRRRTLFWEIFTYDQWTSIVNGRPPSINIHQTDTKFPKDIDASLSANGASDYGWHAWKYRYSASCLSISTQQVFSIRGHNYSIMLHMDRKIREFSIPSHLEAPIQALDRHRSWHPEAYRAMQQYCCLTERECNLLYIHRSYFAQAIQELPENPLSHKFAPSILATFRSACRLISSLDSLYATHPIQTSHEWFFWSGVFSACIVLGALVVESPQCHLAQEALQELDKGLCLFEKGSTPCRASMTVSVLIKLSQRAHAALDAAQAGIMLESSAKSSSPYNPDELQVLGGRKSVIAKPSRDSSPQVAQEQPTSFNRLRAQSTDFREQFGSSHPAVMEYYGALGNPGLILPITREFAYTVSGGVTDAAEWTGMYPNDPTNGLPSGLMGMPMSNDLQLQAIATLQQACFPEEQSQYPPNDQNGIWSDFIGQLGLRPS
ncbi:hypothetical protein CONPUDRAFT_127232 [Coniophora puteana RWD-64-598 SS2]|uniref:Zn(2)-C6 fungal-type domain-containing protein n=1 Tax=Coniophora puteana (strain RWD-64-598) TaxID=741705 RepID=A0A5M3MJH1_CONPW|nr:uncharacterized protein CONPUDRAFT_127232 [Coniophora puteana RWD-64-598 SS2]EIW79263.1 hypothetical protein CONPUDRAFT_127232 [Coniophora puteana RWD-64-598 SS2]